MQEQSLRPSDRFTEKYESYGTMLFRIAMVQLGNKADAEEAVQETFVKLLYKAPVFHEPEHEKAWLILVITNITKNMRRSVWHRRVIRKEEIESYGQTRLMTYQVIDNQSYAEFYENINGYTVNSGGDMLGQLKLEGNIASAQWEKFDSWNNGLQQYTDVTDTAPLTPFLSALSTAKPLAGQPLSDAGIYDDPNQAFLTLTLKDGSAVQLRLFQKGYVKYGNADVFFQVEPAAFGDMWSQVDVTK